VDTRYYAEPTTNVKSKDVKGGNLVKSTTYPIFPAFPDPKTGLFQLEWREDGRRLTRPLGHREWVRAKRQADEFAAGHRPEPERQGRSRPSRRAATV